jgi:hypothetical protein
VQFYNQKIINMLYQGVEGGGRGGVAGAEGAPGEGGMGAEGAIAGAAAAPPKAAEWAPPLRAAVQARMRRRR